jgi:excisionase family DNA binding protein
VRDDVVGSIEAAPAEDVLTVDEVAAWLKVSRRTVERMDLPFAKVGRVRRYVRDQVLDYLKRRAS